ncbi:unnamed protein product [Cuscuta epithymum]|uniref:Exostosin GT47 domain-containing protein n=1 Tax=Cuscuta epithymum TaxID=186058 RepID=A0AAV0DTQ2_9ASTE|nr:unnamed protein product [Cuscuta epithymum]CAH9126658.1 unnamed protein product [Cuscuta epithymum]
MGVLESRRLLWISALVFSMLIMIQIFNHPYGYLPSLFSSSATKGKVAWSSRGSFQMGNSIGKDGDIKDDFSEGSHPKSELLDISNNGSEALNSEERNIDMSGGPEMMKSENISSKESTNGGYNGLWMEKSDSSSYGLSQPPDVNSRSLDMSRGSDMMRSENISSKESNNGPWLEKNDTKSYVVSPPPAYVHVNSWSPAASLVGNIDLIKNTSLNYHSPVMSIPDVKDRSPSMPESKEDPAVVSIAEMNVMLQRSLSSFHSVKPQWSSPRDHDMLHARALIEDAPLVHDAPGLYAPLYRNLSMFKRSYELMEQTLKVYIYSEGYRPIFHTPILKGIYASEGWFMKLLKSNKHFVTKKAKRAHLFYLPFSSRMLEETLYVPNSHDHKPLLKCLSDYLNVIIQRHDFWNRTSGADHFLVACHDWAPTETRRLMTNCIRALCNADAKQGFQFGKDASLPETYVKSSKKPLREIGGNSLSQRQNLAFFAGNMHGYLRPVLLQHWGGNDSTMKIFGPIDMEAYVNYMKSSKYCICAKGYEVNSPRVVEAIFYECVPVIISDNFVPPLFETLNWESFAVFVPEKNIPELKNILASIPDRRFREMQRRVKIVQQHFLWHPKPVKYDAFHMILHSVWHNRVFGIRTNSSI